MTPVRKQRLLESLIFYTSVIALVLFAVLHFPLQCRCENNVFRTLTGETIRYDQMISELRNARMVFAGEVHSNQQHHQLQLNIIRSLHQLSVPVAIGLEMFRADNQGDLDKWASGGFTEEEFIRKYQQNWSLPWPLYREIFLYARNNAIPLVGLNIPAEITKKVAVAGFSSLNEDELRRLPPETGCMVNEQYMKFIRRAYSMHGHGDSQFRYFCEAQLLWDQVMARNLLEFSKKNPEKTIVVIAGNGHAWKRGMPEQVRNLSHKTPFRVVLPYIPGAVEPRLITAEDADFIHFYSEDIPVDK